VSDPSCFAHYLFAATHGHAQAALTLGVLYETGRGLPQSLVLAHAFYTLARDNGDARAGDLLGELEEHMASDQLAAARQFIDEVTDGATACRSPVVEAFAPTQ
jgi:TPR repeat protein